MRDRTYPRTQPPGFAFYLLAATIVLLSLQAIIYLYVLKDTVGPFSIFGEPAPDPALTRKPSIVIFLSEPTARLWAREGDLDRRVAQWTKVAVSAGMPVATVSDGLAGRLANAAVLVLPGAVCLGADERKAITGFLLEGKGVVASGAVGSRREDCSWDGWELLSRLTGSEGAEATSPSSAFVAFRGQRFFSERVPPGYRLGLPAQELTVLAAKDADAFWCDWMLRPNGGVSLSRATLAAHGRYGPGRVVWFGFAETLPRSRSLEQAVLDDYMAAALRWAAKQPMATLGTWPHRKESAVLVAEDVEPGDTNVEEIARLLTQAGVPGNFYLVGSEAKRNPDLVRRLAQAGEVGSAGDGREPLVGEAPLRQKERLLLARRDIDEALRSKVAGFVPPQGLTNAATAAALNEAGYGYYLNEMGVTRSVPEIVEFTPSVLFPLQKTEVLKLFRTAADDFDALADSQAASPAEGLPEAFLSDFRRLHQIGGVYTLFFHSHLLGAPEHREVLKRVVEEIKTRPAWLTTGRALAAWWSGRNKLEVTLKKVSVHRLRLDVANKGLGGVEDVSVFVFLPYHPQAVRLRSTVFRFRPPTSEFLGGPDDLLRIDFPRLAAQTNYTYMVALDEP